MENCIDPIFSRIEFSRFRFLLKAKSSLILPPYKGAVFRGAFGNVLRRIVCVSSCKTCDNCALKRTCVYATVFEPEPPDGYSDADKYGNASPPYVLRPPLTARQSFHPGDTLEFELVLMGRAVEALPYMVYAFTEIGRRGLGKDRGRYELARVDLLRDGSSLPVYDGARQLFYPRLLQKNLTEPGLPVEQVSGLTLEFLTPLRIKVRGELATRLCFDLFFERLVQRIEVLHAFYGNGSRLPEVSALKERSSGIRTVSDDLFWYDWGRYSSRQNADMKFGGLRGRISFEGELTQFMPYLRLGEMLHAGQGTSFGLGWYQIYEYN